MRRRTYLAIITLICFLFTIFNTTMTAYAYEGLPEKIRIGIYFERSAPASVDINSDTGFEIGYEKDGQFVCLARELSTKNLVVRKDTYFINTGALLLEYSPNNPNVPEGTKYGPYHIQVGSTYSNYDLALQESNNLSKKGIQAFPAFINGTFKVWTGLYISLEQAQAAITQIKQSAEGKECGIISPSATSTLIFQQGSNVPKLIFDNNPSSLLIQSIPSKDAVFLIGINGKNYRGGVEFKRFSDSDLTVIDLVDFEQYLYGVLPREMGGDWPLEALKAQAVSARTYAALHINKYQKYGFNLCTTTASQVYGGYSVEKSTCTKAVEETKGKILTYDGRPAYIYYFSTSGGQTEDIENVWGGAGVPYLVSVEDSYEPTEKSARGFWEVTMTPEAVEELLAAKGYDLGKITLVRVLENSNSGRVTKLQILGTKGEQIFEREKARTILGLNSQLYSINTDGNLYAVGNNTANLKLIAASEVKVLSSSGINTMNVSGGRIYAMGANTKKSYAVVPQQYYISGKGWGHGIGLSQWGAWGMANAGFKYDQILTHYFSGTVVE
ncbi:MAG: SpoIID/LytB domain-containing protein [Clostridia bacterium]